MQSLTLAPIIVTFFPHRNRLDFDSYFPASRKIRSPFDEFFMAWCNSSLFLTIWVASFLSCSIFFSSSPAVSAKLSWIYINVSAFTSVCLFLSVRGWRRVQISREGGSAALQLTDLERCERLSNHHYLGSKKLRVSTSCSFSPVSVGNTSAFHLVISARCTLSAVSVLS